MEEAEANPGNVPVAAEFIIWRNQGIERYLAPNYLQWTVNGEPNLESILGLFFLMFVFEREHASGREAERGERRI